MKRHKYYSKYDEVSKFNKGMSKYDVKRLIQEGWKKRNAKPELYGGKEIWQVDMGRCIGFGEKGAKTSILKIVVKEKTKDLVSAYPW